MKHVKGLDTLRAFALLLVIIAHWGPDYYSRGKSHAGRFIQIFFVPDGLFAVTLFFVLSGLLITSILLDAKGEAAGNAIAKLTIIKNFFIRRALRIFPIYYFLIIFLYAVNMGDVRANFLYAATYTMNILCFKTNRWNSISPTWTLAVEEQFYLLWPWFILFTGYRWLKPALRIIIVTGIISSYLVMERLGHIGPFLVFNCFDAFGIGALYAFARLKPGLCHKFERVIFMLIPVTLIIYFRWKIMAYNGQPPGGGISLSKTIDAIISLWLIILIFNSRQGLIKKYVLESRMLNYIGRVSYGMYLYHVPIATLATPVIDRVLIQGAVSLPALKSSALLHAASYGISLAALILVSALSYHLIEMPFLRLKPLFAYSTMHQKCIRNQAV